MTTIGSRVASTKQLKVLIQSAQANDFNRYPSGSLPLDPTGRHILVMVLYGHNMDSARVLHHRVRVLAKFIGDDSPHEFLLDVADDQLSLIPTLAEFQAQYGIPQEA